jgi:hypothetical protein
MRKLVYLAIAVLVAAAIGVGVLARTPGIAHAANSEHAHFFGNATFPDNLCGFDGTSTFFTRDNYRVPDAGGSIDTGQVKQTFVADNGRGVVIMWDAGRLQFEPPIANPDGRTTIIAITSGQNVKTQALNGPVLETGTGRAEFIEVYDADGNPISFIGVALSGPENDLTGAPDCGVIGPYLAGA